MKIKFLSTFLLLMYCQLLMSQIPTSNLKMWINADSVQITSGFIQTCWDLSGNNNHATQSTAANRPTKIVSSTFNGKNVIKFDGVNDALGTSTPMLNNPLSSTTFIVFNSNTNTQADLINQFQGSGAGRQIWGINSAGDFFGFGALGYSFTRSGPSLITMSNNSLTNGHKTRLNGVLRHTGTLASIQQVNTIFGARAINGSLTLNGEIAEIIIYNTLLNDSLIAVVENYLINKYSPRLNLGSDTIINYGLCSMDLSIDSTFTNVNWSTGSSNKKITVSQSGLYYVSAKNIFGQTLSDSISITFLNPSINNSSICLGDTLTVQSPLDSFYSKLWSTNETSNAILIQNAGNYSLTLTDTSQCSKLINFNVSVDSFSVLASLGNDTSFCSGNSISLIQGSNLAENYLWHPSLSTDSSIAIVSTGTYSLLAENSLGCLFTDTINVNINGFAPIPLIAINNTCLGDTTLVLNNSLSIDSIINTTWIVNNTDTIETKDLTYYFSQPGINNISIFLLNESNCSKDSSFTIQILDKPTAFFNNAPICVNTPTTFTNTSLFANGLILDNYEWYIDNVYISNTEDLTYTFNTAGTYVVKLIANSTNGCFDIFEKTIVVESSFPLPSNFSLTSPLNESTQISSNFPFVWEPANDALYFRLLISSDELFQNIIFQSSNIDTNYFLFTGSLSAPTYFWKIIAYNPCNIFVESQVFSFDYLNIESLPGLSMWIHADSVQTSNGLIQTCWDLSGNNNHAIQANTANRPEKMVSTTLNGKNVIKFDGLNDALGTLNPILSDPPITTTFIVFNPYTSAQADLLNQFQGSVANRQIWGINALGNFYGFGQLAYNIPISGASLISMSNSALSNGHRTNLNGNLMHSGTLTSIQQVNTVIGARALNGSLTLNGEIAEILIFNSLLNNDTIDLIENYLMDKYAQPVNLGPDISENYSLCGTSISVNSYFKSLLWSTGETSTSINIDESGSYWVEALDVFNRYSYDTIEVDLVEKISPPNSVFCSGDTITWTSNLISNDYTYLWSNSSASASIEIFEEGYYYLSVSDSFSCSYVSDTIYFAEDSIYSTFYLSNDTSLCSNNILSILETGAYPISSYLWSNNDTTETTLISSSGTYWVEVVNENNCIAKDSVDINVLGVAPVVEFSQTNLCENVEVFFVDESDASGSLITNWAWTFDTLGFSNSQNPTFNFNNRGIYNIILTVQSQNGCINSTHKNIEIQENPQANFSFDISCAQSNTQITSTSIESNFNEINTWTWYLNNVITSNDENPLIFFPTEGSNLVSLYVEDEAGCSDTISKLVEIFPALLPDFSFENICIGDSVQFTDETESFSIIQRTWDFGFFNQSSNLENPTFYYPSVDTYTVSLSLINAIGCENSIEKTIAIKSLPKASASFENLCEGSESILYDNSNFDNTNLLNNSWLIEGDNFEGDTLSHIFNASGTYSILYEVTDGNGCFNDTTLPLTIQPLPEVDFSFTPNYGTAPLEVDFTNLSTNANAFTWVFDNLGNSSTDINPSFTYLENGNYTIRLYATNAALCSDSLQKIIAIIPTELDVELSNLSIEKPELNNGALAYKASVLVKNVGTRNINNIDLLININTENQLAEYWEGNLGIGQAFLYEFSSFLYINNEEVLDYVCVEASNVNDNTELLLENNIVCEIQKGLIQSSFLYPNPASDLVNLDLILANNGLIEVAIFDLKGSVILDWSEINGKKGYNKVTFNTKNLQAGNYFVQVVYQDEVYSFPLTLLNK